MRAGAPGLLSLPWHVPPCEWDPTEVALRDVPVGPSRHLVRFVESDGRLFAAKEMPFRLVEHEYRVLTALRREGLPAVAPIGAVDQRLDADDNGVLITDYDGVGAVPERKKQFEPQRGPRPATGYIALQNHDPTAVVSFKEVSLEPLKAKKPKK